MRVLLVEDNADLRDLIVEVLRDEPASVVACADAHEAERLFAAEPFDLLLTDVGLPGLSGSELAHRLLVRKPDLWIVFLSGRPLGPVDAWGPRARALMKPFQIDQLLGLVDEAIASVHGG